MRVVEVRERTVPNSRYADASLATDGLTTSAVAVVTDVRRGGAPVLGCGIASFGRCGGGRLIR